MKSPFRHLIAAAALSALSLIAQAAKVAVIDESGLNGFQDYADQHLSAPLKAAIQQHGLAVYIETDSFQLKQAGYCVAVAGLTTPAKGKWQARSPADAVIYVVRQPLGKDELDRNACQAEAARNVVETLNKSKLEDALANIERTREEGVPRAKQKADKETVNLYSDGLSAVTKADVFKAIHEYAVASVFDYRYATVALLARNVVFADGERVCWARASFVAMPPSEREVRLPYSWHSSLHVSRDEAGCASDAAVAAVRGKLNQSWDEQGLLKGFKQTRENGVPLPDFAAVAKQVAAIRARQQRQAQQQVRSQQHNVVSCTNRCVNGACVRTFANGRKENWQAPRVYDALKNDWTWDTNSCGQ